MKRIIQAAAAAAIWSGLSGAAFAADLKDRDTAIAAALDPVVPTLGTNWLVAASVCEGLYALDDNWRPQLMLAESAAYDEASLTLTLTLRSEIKFHSGAPLMADDVVASLQKQDPKRFRTLWGAGRAAEASGDTERARRYYTQPADMSGAGGPRPELVEANAWLATN